MGGCGLFAKNTTLPQPRKKRKMKMFEVQTQSGRKFPVIRRKQGAMETDECPYCGGTHIHGTAPGHRIAHCTNKALELNVDGERLTPFDGYIIVHY